MTEQDASCTHEHVEYYDYELRTNGGPVHKQNARCLDCKKFWNVS